ncbi:MAG: MOSC domain-containing protein [Planctomycetota bacterium]
MATPHHRSADELAAGLAAIEQAPAEAGTLQLVVRRPEVDAREVLAEGRLDPAAGLVGDSWSARPSRRPDRLPDHDKQLNIMSARAASLIAGERDHWALAGDQLYVDLDLSIDNLPTGARLAIGDAVVEVTAPPHNGCAKFQQRFGADALRFVNSDAGKRLRLRGLNARVIRAGTVRPGDAVRRLPPA